MPQKLRLSSSRNIEARRGPIWPHVQVLHYCAAIEGVDARTRSMLFGVIAWLGGVRSRERTVDFGGNSGIAARGEFGPALSCDTSRPVGYRLSSHLHYRSGG